VPGGLATAIQVGYDTLRGDPFFQMDMRVAKNIRLGEGRRLQLIFQAFKSGPTRSTFRATTTFNSTNQVNFFEAGQASSIPRARFTFLARSSVEFGARFTF